MKLDSIERKTLAYHSTLNPVLWNGLEMKDDVRNALLAIGQSFIKTFGWEIPILDIVVTGSNASYNWNVFSDIDIHVIADMAGHPKAEKEFVAAYLKAQKQLWNQNRKVTVKGYSCELYAQDSTELLIASGVFSLTKNEWIKMPTQALRPRPNMIAVKAKVVDFTDRINDAIMKGDEEEMLALVKKLSDLRKSGLQSKGELSTENLAFKILRNSGVIAKLRNALESSTDRKLTLESVKHPHKGPRAHKGGAKKYHYVNRHKGPKVAEGGLSSADRWKKHRTAKLWAWKRQRFSRLAREKPGTEKNISHRTYMAARNLTYKAILGKRKKSKLPFGERARAERTAKRVYSLNIRNPENRVRYKYRRKDTTKRSGVSYKNP